MADTILQQRKSSLLSETNIRPQVPPLSRKVSTNETGSVSRTAVGSPRNSPRTNTPIKELPSTAENAKTVNALPVAPRRRAFKGESKRAAQRRQHLRETLQRVLQTVLNSVRFERNRRLQELKMGNGETIVDNARVQPTKFMGSFAFNPDMFKSRVKVSATAMIQKILETPSAKRTEHDLQQLDLLISGMGFFGQRFSRRERLLIAKVIYYRRFEKGRVILRQNDPANGFYFILSGAVAVYQNVPNPETNQSETQFIRDLVAGTVFGEVAILRNERRAATIIVTTDYIELICMDRDDFLSIMGSTMSQQVDFLVQFLQQQRVFRHLTHEQVRPLAELCQIRDFSQNQTIVREGDTSNFVYFLLSGTCRALKAIPVPPSVNHASKNKISATALAEAVVPLNPYKLVAAANTNTTLQSSQDDLIAQMQKEAERVAGQRRLPHHLVDLYHLQTGDIFGDDVLFSRLLRGQTSLSEFGRRDAIHDCFDAAAIHASRHIVSVVAHSRKVEVLQIARAEFLRVLDDTTWQRLSTGHVASMHALSSSWRSADEYAQQQQMEEWDPATGKMRLVPITPAEMRRRSEVDKLPLLMQDIMASYVKRLDWNKYKEQVTHQLEEERAAKRWIAKRTF